ncbi:hypothetical protein AAFC00_001607 [Neodothiora populina]|uniref:ABC transmembrane type-1 domain-containing protein n=1 Tax=Neodothiora populina TaxID=2781224 RepID=A0ABR3PPG5_9PEZI
MVRGALVSIIYQKTLSVDAALVSGSQATTLMSADIEQIAVGLQSLNELWANFVEAIVGLWLLERQIGLSFLAAAIIAIICAVLASIVAGVAASRQKHWLTAMERRIHETTRFLQSSKSIKMPGLEDKVSETIASLRAAELRKGVHWVSRTIHLWRTRCLDKEPFPHKPQLAMVH